MQSPLAISVHARVRYVERCLDLPIAKLAADAGVDPHNDGCVWRWAVRNGFVNAEAVRSALVSPAIVAAVHCGATCVDLGNGYKAMIENGCVVTVLSKATSAQRRKSLERPPNRYVDKMRSRGFKHRRIKDREHDYA
jgi:hypothetical protein